MGITIIAAAVLSAPGNELRGYCLQPADRAKPFAEFFQPEKFVRSTSVGALIMATSLSVGAVVTPRAERLWATIRELLKQNPAGYLVVIAALFFLMRRSKDEKGSAK